MRRIVAALVACALMRAAALAQPDATEPQPGNPRRSIVCVEEVEDRPGPSKQRFRTGLVTVDGHVLSGFPPESTVALRVRASDGRTYRSTGVLNYVADRFLVLISVEWGDDGAPPALSLAPRAPKPGDELTVVSALIERPGVNPVERVMPADRVSGDFEVGIHDPEFRLWGGAVLTTPDHEAADSPRASSSERLSARSLNRTASARS